jgi:hypothetical protein
LIMPTAASAGLRAAVRDALVADTAILNVLGGPKIYDEPPRAAAFPYVARQSHRRAVRGRCGQGLSGQAQRRKYQRKNRC